MRSMRGEFISAIGGPLHIPTTLEHSLIHALKFRDLWRPSRGLSEQRLVFVLHASSFFCTEKTWLIFYVYGTGTHIVYQKCVDWCSFFASPCVKSKPQTAFTRHVYDINGVVARQRHVCSNEMYVQDGSCFPERVRVLTSWRVLLSFLHFIYMRTFSKRPSTSGMRFTKRTS